MASEATKAMDWVVKKGPMSNCAHCAAGKARQKNVNKIPPEEPLPQGVLRVYLDLTHIIGTQGRSIVGPSRLFWILSFSLKYLISSKRKMLWLNQHVNYSMFGNSKESMSLISEWIMGEKMWLLRQEWKAKTRSYL